MNHRATRLWVGVCLALFASHAEADDIHATFVWTTEPFVRVCQHSEVSPEQARRAMAYWERLGARFAGLDVAPCAFREDGAPLRDDPRDGLAFNAITITHLGQAGTVGRTNWALYGEVPLWAVITMSPGEHDDLALKHELGHALGYPHVNAPGHVMYPKRDRLGESAVGLAEVGTLALARGR